MYIERFFEETLETAMYKHQERYAVILVIVFVIIAIYLWTCCYHFDQRYETTLSAVDEKGKTAWLKIGRDVDWSKIQQRPKPDKKEIHDRWIVVTSVASPTDQVKKLSKIKEWQLVVVADIKTPKDWE